MTEDLTGGTLVAQRAHKIIKAFIYDDPEITAMGAIVQVLNDLDLNSKRRVVQWAASRWGDEIQLISTSKTE